MTRGRRRRGPVRPLRYPTCVMQSRASRCHWRLSAAANPAVIATTTFSAATTPGDGTITATDETGITGSFGVSVVVGPATKLVFVNQPSDAGWRVVMRP